MNKWRILAIIFTLFWLVIIIYVQKQSTNTRNQDTNENMDERVELVEREVPDAEINKDSPEELPAMENEITVYIQEIFDTSWGIDVCWCESGCRPDAYNPAGPYISLYQFDYPTWNSNCEGDIHDWKDQVNCAHKLYKKGEVWRWPTCGYVE